MSKKKKTLESLLEDLKVDRTGLQSVDHLPPGKRKAWARQVLKHNPSESLRDLASKILLQTARRPVNREVLRKKRKMQRQARRAVVTVTATSMAKITLAWNALVVKIKNPSTRTIDV